MKTRSTGFWVFFALLAVVLTALLELNKNALYAWAIVYALLIAYAVIRQKYLRGSHVYLRIVAFLAVMALICQTLWGVGKPTKLRPAVEKSGGMTEVVTLRDGKVQGVKTADGAVEVFTGIPYAKPPVGELRWKAPENPEPWSGVRTCTHFAPMAMQPRNSEIYNSLSQIIGFHDYEISLDDHFRDAVSEDALYVNLWRPAGAQEKLPVLVYIHGGALQTGQPWYADYSGEGLARKGVLVVNFGYRLGVFGFLATEELAREDPNGSTGNYGLMDQIKALKWVQDNIATFGGDPEEGMTTFPPLVKVSLRISASSSTGGAQSPSCRRSP